MPMQICHKTGVFSSLYDSDLELELIVTWEKKV